MNAGGIRRAIAFAVVALLLCALAGCNKKGSEATSTPTPPTGSVTPAQAREIAKDAYVYGFPMVDSYRIQYSYFVDQQSPDFKAPGTRSTTPPGYTRRPTPPSKPPTPTPRTRLSAPTCGPSRWC